MNTAKKQLLTHLRQTIDIGNGIISGHEFNDDALEQYHNKLEELVAYATTTENMNFLVAKKIKAIVTYNEATDYDGKLNIILKKIIPPNKKAHKKKNLDNYVKKQNLLLAAIEYYYKHEA
jgi:hypothetical protein